MLKNNMPFFLGKTRYIRTHFVTGCLVAVLRIVVSWLEQKRAQKNKKEKRGRRPPLSFISGSGSGTGSGLGLAKQPFWLEKSTVWLEKSTVWEMGVWEENEKFGGRVVKNGKFRICESK